MPPCLPARPGPARPGPALQAPWAGDEAHTDPRGRHPEFPRREKPGWRSHSNGELSTLTQRPTACFLTGQETAEPDRSESGHTSPRRPPSTRVTPGHRGRSAPELGLNASNLSRQHDSATVATANGLLLGPSPGAGRALVLSPRQPCSLGRPGAGPTQHCAWAGSHRPPTIARSLGDFSTSIFHISEDEVRGQESRRDQREAERGVAGPRPTLL